jgi:hypothetical protein
MHKFIIIITCGFYINSYAYSNEYKIGYVTCIINDTIPEEKLSFHIEGQDLKISLLRRELDPPMKEILINRLKKTNFFQTIHISFEESAPSLNKSLKREELVNAHNSHPIWETLPSGVIYDTPLADPQWPRFSAGYAKHLKNNFGKSIFNLSFGENLPLLRYKTDGWTYEFGLQAGLTGLMDIAGWPSRLIASDYFVGAALSFVYDRRWQNMVQFSHLSAHLGDEFLISRPDYMEKRVNLSYEAFKWYTAYRFDSLRPYIGLGYLVDRDPSYLKPFTLEGGIDYIFKETMLFDTTRPVFGVYTHMWSQNNFKPSLRIRTGLQVENPVLGGRHLQFLIDYSCGKSRQGQFYAKREHYIGMLIAIAN